MKSYGMDQKLKLIRLIKTIYSETQLAVVNGHLSEWFPMTVGNRQGDPLSPHDHLLCSYGEWIKSRIEKTVD